MSCYLTFSLRHKNYNPEDYKYDPDKKKEDYDTSKSILLADYSTNTKLYGITEDVCDFPYLADVVTQPKEVTLNDLDNILNDINREIRQYKHKIELYKELKPDDCISTIEFFEEEIAELEGAKMDIVFIYNFMKRTYYNEDWKLYAYYA